jgi:hypothetical protein
MSHPQQTRADDTHSPGTEGGGHEAVEVPCPSDRPGGGTPSFNRFCRRRPRSNPAPAADARHLLSISADAASVDGFGATEGQHPKLPFDLSQA